jgi:hypothetical protein
MYIFARLKNFPRSDWQFSVKKPQKQPEKAGFAAILYRVLN